VGGGETAVGAGGASRKLKSAVPLRQAHGLSEAPGLIQPHAAPDGSDTDVPPTILIDRGGTVGWLYRSPSVIERLSPDEVTRAVDQHLR
jgi:hypothetical protein